MPTAIKDIECIWITLADGCRLAARLWLPADAELHPVPAILEYIPYRRRDSTRLRDEGMHPWLAEHGYAAIRVDMRGSGDSDGLLHDEYLQQEQDDALEVIAWLARQPWCTGKVGMMGKSWGAFNSLQVAALRPPALGAIVAVMGTDDRYAEDVHYSGGCLLGDNFWWGTAMQIYNARPPDPEIVGKRWRAMWLERLEAERFWPELWLEHQTFDDYWKHGSVKVDYSAIQCPAWIWGGWADGYRDTPFRLAANLASPVKVTMGPWAHLYPHEARPKPTVGFLEEMARWFDHWLKGIDNGVMSEPRHHFHMMDGLAPAPFYPHRPGRWVAEDVWPSPRVQELRLSFGPDGLTAEAGAEVPLNVASPQTTGFTTGDWAGFAVPGDLPADQRLDSPGSLELDGDVLTAPLEILGNPEAVLELSADKPAALVAVRLIDVAPDGSASIIARGFLNLTHRRSREKPEPVVPGERMRVRVPLHAIGYVVPAGHKLRVAISNAYWPLLWPSPESTRLTLYAGPSHIVLPVRQHDASSVAMTPATRPVSSPVTTLRKGSNERTITIDQVTGEIRHRVYVDGGVFGDAGKIRLEAIGLEMAHMLEDISSIRPDDPCSAKLSSRQSFEMGRGDWQVRIETTALMTSTPTTFEIDSSVAAYEGGSQVFQKASKRSIPRNGL